MFEDPAEQRVKRSKLWREDSSEEDAHDGNANLLHVNSGLAYDLEYELLTIEPTESVGSTAKPQESNDHNESFQFNLFSANSRPTISQNKIGDAIDTPKTQLISIRSPSPVDDVPISEMHLQKARPQSYYLTGALPSTVKKQLQAEYTSSAISSNTILAQSKSLWSGCAMQWKVLRLPIHARQIVLHRVNQSDTSEDRSAPTDGGKVAQVDRSRARPGSKRRALIKAKAMKRQRIIDETKTKEEHEREKKNKKNRERKLKRRAKERKEKALRGAGDQQEAASAQSSDGD